MKKDIPFLCGGILFGLIYEAKKQRTEIRRASYNSKGDSLSIPEVFSGFISIFTGSNDNLKAHGDSLKKCASKYRTCESSHSTYIPFKDMATRSSFESKLKNNRSEIWERVSNFTRTYLDEQKCEWLVKAILETIKTDISIEDNQEIEIGINMIRTKKVIEDIREIDFVVFLTSVIEFVLLTRPECEPGRDTFEKWYTQKGERNPWVFQSTIGKKWPSIQISFKSSFSEDKYERHLESIGDSGNSEEENELDDDESCDCECEEFFRDNSVSRRMLKQIEKGNLDKAAQDFCVVYEKQMDLLPLCQIALFAYPLHTFESQMYNSFALLSEKSRRSLLKIFKISEIKIKKKKKEERDWILACIEKYEREIETEGLTTLKFLYDGAKYFMRTFRRYYKFSFEEYNPSIFDSFEDVNRIPRTISGSKFSISDYIGDFFWYKREEPERETIPPFNYLWNHRNLGECSEKDMTYWVCVFIIESINQLNIIKNEEISSNDDFWGIFCVDTTHIRTYEDLFFYALLFLYERYME